MMGEYSVYQFFPDNTSQCVISGVDAEKAVETARSYCARPSAMIGITKRVIITDGGDSICFEWEYGEGVTFPPEAAGKEPRPFPLQNEPNDP